MAKLPDVGALGNAPNLRGAGTAQADARLLRGGANDILEGALGVAKAYTRGGDSISRSMAVAGEQAVNAAGGDIASGRAMQQHGINMGAAITRGGDRVANAMERSGDYWAAATEKVGKQNAQAAAALGGALQGVANEVIEYQLAQDRQAFAQAKTAFAIDKVGLDEEFKRDQDYATMPDRYGARLNELRSKAGESVRNPVLRQRFDAETGLTYASGLSQMKDRAFRVESDVNRADLNKTLDGMLDASMREPDPTVRAQYLKDSQRRISGAVGKGWISAQDGERTSKSYAEAYGIAEFERLPPEQQIERVQAVRAARTQAEATGAATATKTSGDFVSEKNLHLIERNAIKALTAQRTAEVKQLEETYEGNILDFKAGKAQLVPWEQIANDKRLPIEVVNKLKRQHLTVAKEDGAHQEVSAILASGGQLNRFKPEHQKGVNREFEIQSKLVGPELAAERIIRQSNMVPDQVTLALRNDIASQDQAQVGRGLDAASRMMGFNPQIFAGEKGKSELQEAATMYTSYLENLGWTKERAAQEVMRKQSPQFKSEVRSDLKEVNLSKEAQEKTKLSDLENAKQFKNNWWVGEDIDDRVKKGMLDAYQTAFMKNREAGRTVDDAKDIALQDMSNVWGLTAVNGKEVITHLPPEKMYTGVKNASEHIAAQAVEQVNLRHGESVDRTKIMLTPIPGVTVRDFESKRPPRYMVSYQDRNGHWQISPTPFAADPEKMTGMATADAVKRAQDNAVTRPSREEAAFWQQYMMMGQ